MIGHVHAFGLSDPLQADLQIVQKITVDQFGKFGELPMQDSVNEFALSEGVGIHVIHHVAGDGGIVFKMQGRDLCRPADIPPLLPFPMFLASLIEGLFKRSKMAIDR
jgi:hypothetical protein